MTGAFFRPDRPVDAVRPIGLDEDVEAPWVTRRWLKLTGIRQAYRVPVRPADRRRVITALFHEGSRRGAFAQRYASLMVLSVAIAALGLLANSTAVVIGAMLVAPLLGPTLGISAAIVMAWPRRIMNSVAIVLLGAIGSVALAALVSLVVPGTPNPIPDEVLARTSPNLLDLGIALAAGAAGAYGQLRRLASDALPGVAVAVALIPPLAVIGISLQMAEWQYAIGSSLLFLTNIAGIVFAGAVTFIVAGFVPGQRLLSGNLTIAHGLRWAALAVIAVVIPLQMGRGHLLPERDHTEEVTAALHEYIGGPTSTIDIVEVTVDVQGPVADIDVVLASPFETPAVNELAKFLAEELNRPVDVALQVVETDRTRATVTTTPP